MTDETIYRIIDAFRDGKIISLEKWMYDVRLKRDDNKLIVCEYIFSLPTIMHAIMAHWCDPLLVWFIDGVEVEDE